jgi:hypothetical protein
MAFTLTYTDGQADNYDDDTKWEVEGGVLKLGKQSGDWTVFVSPGHWATIELGKKQEKKPDKKDQDKDKGKDKEEDQAKDQDADESEESADEDRAEAS